MGPSWVQFGLDTTPSPSASMASIRSRLIIRARLRVRVGKLLVFGLGLKLQLTHVTGSIHVGFSVNCETEFELQVTSGLIFSNSGYGQGYH